MSNAKRVTRRVGLRVAVAGALTVPLSSMASVSAARPRGHLEVMTFNLRYASTAEPNSWADRRPVMRSLLRRAAPDVIGTQEGRYEQLRDIQSDLEHYEWIGTGRKRGSHDESMAVFYDTRRLAPVEYEHFWLSDTPELIGSNTWGGEFPRMVTWVRFRELRGDGPEFYVLNTHLDNRSQYARVRGASLIAQRIGGLDRSLPVVVTGDFNAVAHENPVYGTVLGAGLADAWDAAAERGPLYGTFHGYKPLTRDGDRIDWILVGSGVSVRHASVDTFSANGQFPSDHLPVRASLELE
ncbi:endonuclease/exonuclease/phosphatase family protein [Streptomyces coacervatus]|uniref:Endonuclease/exonuclease/phosphatase family protein n=1 Tax=Streptomyces coacervatus TaxID=647381 RepID=A0ABP7H079_9ACTN|nr:endonuclease/exonuclease/phosphatase family protein [Streptomyces coacervatus]MDF2268448.1 endonuclease/exonuclease/phosphatase family protein [Streptomyces coacervatus]